eukprot:comp21176_c0_seq1/m.28709 comp21176_c0_seq1/g.28709  ORF comp21176_c0_seq1/g.28709 comp21176_c0_seq1/m.28709 type:complete len:401 (-) comp21176_c0_seq1:66-1268(-)
MSSYEQKLLAQAQRATALLTPEMLKRLETHTYKSSDASFLDYYVMQYFWNWVVNYVPAWVAPNLLTITGLAINAVVTAGFMWQVPHMEGDAGTNWYLLCAASVFVYQTLDAIDGKQARRTGSGSCLGELFDHGCDAFSNTLVVLATVTTAQMGTSVGGALVVINFLLAFYCAHWQTFVTGVLEFGWVDVTEGQMLMIAVHLTTALLGPAIWNLPVAIVPGLQLKHVVALGATSASTIAVLRNMHTIFIKNEKPTVAGTSVVQPIWVPAWLLGMFYYLFTKGSIEGGAAGSLYSHYSVLMILTFGAVMAKMSIWLVIAHMAKAPHKFWDKTMWALLALCINARYQIVDQPKALLGVCLYVHLSLMHFSYHVCRQIANHFGLRIFHIKYPNKACPGYKDTTQ